MPDYDPESIPILDDVIATSDDENRKTDASSSADRDDDFFVEIADEAEAEFVESDAAAATPEIIPLEETEDAVEDEFDLFTAEPEVSSSDDRLETNPEHAKPEPQLGELDSAFKAEFVENTIYIDSDIAAEHEQTVEPIEPDFNDSDFIKPESIEPEITESAIVDYSSVIRMTEDITHTDYSETVITEERTIEHLQAASPHVDSPEIADNTAGLDTDLIIEDVVNKILPDLEQQLRLALQQALKEKLPAEFVPGKIPADDQTEN